MSDAVVLVSGLSPDTTQQSLEHFLSFCGKIKSITKTDKTATVEFEKSSAAKTSLMLDGGSLDGVAIRVTAPESAKAAGEAAPRPTSAEGDEVRQDDKPHSAKIAEMLGHGYVLTDAAVTRAIELDQKHGISSKFLTWFQKLDDKYSLQTRAATAHSNVQTRASTLDAKTGASAKMGSLMSTGMSYYEKALASPHGAKVREFYTNAKKEALDVHQEARRIAEEKAGRPIWQQTLPRMSADAPPPAPPADAAAAAPEAAGAAPGFEVKS